MFNFKLLHISLEKFESELSTNFPSCTFNFECVEMVLSFKLEQQWNEQNNRNVVENRANMKVGKVVLVVAKKKITIALTRFKSTMGPAELWLF